MDLKISTIILVLLGNLAQLSLTHQSDSSVSISAENVLHNATSDAENNLTIHKDLVPAETSSSHDEDDDDDDNEDDEEDSDGPSDHIIPFSEHEDPGEIPTRPKYVAPGAWAKPPPEKNVQLDFVPTKLYAQVRGTHTVKHVPREEAIESAETGEETNNAPRLKEVVNNRKVNTVYTEEGYEDSAYDHGGHIRDADFHEGFARKLENELDTTPDDEEQPVNQSAKQYRVNKHPDVELLDDYRHHIDRSDVRADEREEEYQEGKKKNIKNVLKKPRINPKRIAQKGILQLEKDLKTEYLEAAKASEINSAPQPPQDETEVYETTTLFPKYRVENKEKSKTDLPTTGVPDAVEVNQDFVTTISTNSPETINIAPLSTVTSDDVTEDFGVETFTQSILQPSSTLLSIEFPTVEVPVTETSGDEFWRIFMDRQRQRGTHELSGLEPEPLTTSSVIESSTPIELALVNGHGPYLWDSESLQPEITSNPFQGLPPSDVIIQSERRMEDGSAQKFFDNTQFLNSPAFPSSISTIDTFSHWDHNPFLGPVARSVEATTGKKLPYYKGLIRDHGDSNLENNKRSKKKIFEEKKKINKGTSARSENSPDMLARLTMLQPPSITAAREITYSYYLRDPHVNILGQSRVKVESETPKESGYDHSVANHVKSNANDLHSGITKKIEVPATNLVPPSPLSKSEYASFSTRSRRNDFIPFNPYRTPVFHTQRTSRVPGFRHKRSINYSTENSEVDKLKEPIFGAKIRKVVKHLLNESPRITDGVINEEIDKRFKNNNTNGNGSESENDKNSANESQVEVDEPDFDFSDDLENAEENETNVTEKGMEVDHDKYPFYENRDSLSGTALKYVVNPNQIPRKTLGGMEFYNSRNMKCDDIEPDLTDVTPEGEEPSPNRGLNENTPRLEGLGNKLDCFKAKYFDRNPLDNPLFIEKNVEQPTPPSELDPKNFSSRISEMPITNEENINTKLSRRPEISIINKRESPPRNMQAMSINYGLGPKSHVSNHLRNNQKQRLAPTSKSRKRKSKPSTDNPTAESATPYQKLVYEDVMGNIQNLEKLEKNKLIRPFNFRSESGQFHPHMPINKYTTPPGAKHILPSMREKGTGIPLVDITENPLPPKFSNIDGLFPPRGRIRMMPMRNKNILFSNRPRNPDYSYEELPWQNVRVFKRSVNNEQHLQENESLTATTPLYRRLRRPPISVSNILITNYTAPSIKKIIYPNEIKSKNTPSRDKTRNYGKFTNSASTTGSTDIRRNEPRYMFPKRRNSTVQVYTSTPRPSTSKPLIGRVPPTTSSFADSTLVAVVVKPDANFTIPQESRRTKIFRKVEDQDLETSIPTRDFSRDNSGSLPGSEIDHIAQKSIQKYDTLGAYVDSNDSKQQNTSDDDAERLLHMRLLDYARLSDFNDNDTVPKQTKPNPEELHSNNSQKIVLTNRNDTDDDSEESSEESSVENNSSTRSSKSEEDDSNEKEESEPFTRFTSRPYSPPEDFYDERYADIGPRINKPAFYHPPFETPDYEKSHFGKSDDQSDENFDHSAEGSDHEKYVFPWDRDHHDDDEENIEESEHSFFSYEFPWEKREREERERRVKEKPITQLHRDYHYADEDDEEEAATTHRESYIYRPQKGYYADKIKLNIFDNLAAGSEPQSEKVFSSKIKSIFQTPEYADQAVKSTESVDNMDLLFNDTMLSIEKLFMMQPKPKVAMRNATSTPQNKEVSVETTTSTTSTLSTSTTSRPTTRIEPTQNQTTVEYSSQTSETTTIVPRTRRRSQNHIPTTSKPKVTSTKKPRPSFGNRRRQTSQRTTTELPTTSLKPSKRNFRKGYRKPANDTQNLTTSKQSLTDKITEIPSYTSTALRTSPATSKTVQQRSRISKKTVTKTYYPSEEEEDDDDISSNEMQNLKSYRNIDRKIHNSTKNNKPIITEKTETVSIITKETPDHVYRTEEIDKDGVKGKFVTITANNKTTTPSSREEELSLTESDIEETNGDLALFGKFDTVIQDSTEDADNYPATAVNLNRRHRAVRLSEHNTKHTFDTFSWTSENYT